MHRSKLKEYFGDSFLKSPNVKSTKPTIFICFTNRSGSTYLASTLSEYGITCKPNEELNYEYFNFSVIKNFSLKNYSNSISDYMSMLFSKYSSNNFFTSKLSLDQLIWFLEEKYIPTVFGNPKFIFIKRRDLLLQAISLSIAIQTRKWTSFHDGLSIKKLDLVFDPVQILRKIQNIDTVNSEFERLFKLNNMEVFVVYYEDLIEKKEEIIYDIGNYIDKKLVKDEVNNFAIARQSTEINSLWRKKFVEYYKSQPEIIRQYKID